MPRIANYKRTAFNLVLLIKQLIIRTIERYCTLQRLLTDTPHCKDNWETPFITKTIEIYPSTRDAASNQHLADKEDEEEGSNCTLQRHAELDDESVAGYKIRRSFGKTDGTRPFTRCPTQVL